jgi:DNA repair protein RadC
LFQSVVCHQPLFILRDVLKPAILANAAALVLGHNHPSGDITPSIADHEITKIIIQAANVIGITIHEHLIISMDDEKYFSFAQEGLIRDAYETVKNQNIA